mmetsp:Transcript_42357/g.59322  ORF Transcript_42357/g.59322 Transcript_42357/m.59322 type:complete len:160 (+) Transcript_42357:358-837(+)
MRNHIRKFHSTPEEVECKECGKKLRSGENGMTQHLRVVHGHSPPSFPCPVDGCEKSFTRNSNLKTHIKTFHEKRKDFRCSFEGCEKAFAHKISLQKHEHQHLQPPEKRQKQSEPRSWRISSNSLIGDEIEEKEEREEEEDVEDGSVGDSTVGAAKMSER